MTRITIRENNKNNNPVWLLVLCWNSRTIYRGWNLEPSCCTGLPAYVAWRAVQTTPFLLASIDCSKCPALRGRTFPQISTVSIFYSSSGPYFCSFSSFSCSSLFSDGSWSPALAWLALGLRSPSAASNPLLLPSFQSPLCPPHYCCDFCFLANCCCSCCCCCRGGHCLRATADARTPAKGCFCSCHQLLLLPRMMLVPTAAAPACSCWRLMLLP